MTNVSNTPIILPPPQMDGGKPFMNVLRDRQSTREFSSKPLRVETLSNLLWAATGVNRHDSGKRTAPSARDWREIDIYVVMADGAYRYDAQKHVMISVITRDIRKITGEQDFVATAPVNMVYVASFDRMVGADVDLQIIYSATDTGFIAQNVYLFCASTDLATVVRGSVDRDTLGAALGLGKHQRVILAQSVGYPSSPL